MAQVYKVEELIMKLNTILREFVFVIEKLYFILIFSWWPWFKSLVFFCCFKGILTKAILVDEE